MKNKNLLLIIALFFSTLIIYGQAPQRIDFQAMARDGSGNPMMNQNIAVKITVKEGATTVYAERHTLTTDEYGLFTLSIGEGAPISGSFAAIDWSLGNQRVKVEVDPNGGTSYVYMGTSDLASTPYAFYGEDDDADPVNELQTLSLSGNDLSISDGNTVTLPGGGSSLWTANGDDIYYNDGNVGIGTDAPAEFFHVDNAGGPANTLITSTQSYYIADASGNSGLWLKENDVDVGFLYWNPPSQAIFMYENGNQTMAWKENKVGVGINDPLVKLHVVESGSDGVVGSDLGLEQYPGSNHSAAVYGEEINATSASNYSYGVLGRSSSSNCFLTAGVYGEANQSSSLSLGIWGYSNGTSGFNAAIYGAVVETASTNYAGYFVGDVHVTGTLSKAGGSFKIDHPQDPANKYLIHSFVESPDMMNVYNGNVVTDAEGLAVIELPSYFEAENIDFKYQLTVIGQFAQAIIKEEIANNRFTIQTDKPNVKVSWQVTGVRNDAWANAHRVVPEVEKKGEERGHYLHPELYGKSKELGLPVGMYEHHNQSTHNPAPKPLGEQTGPMGIRK